MITLAILVIYALILTALLAYNGLREDNDIPSHPAGDKINRILIIGATGGTGLQLVEQAIEKGFFVTALVRNPDKFKIKHSQLQVVKGDVLDFGSIEKAVQGQDAVVSALGHKQFFGPTRILSEGTANIIRAMEKTGVKRLICETSLGIGASAGRMGLYYTFFVIPFILPFYFWDKTRQERIISESATEWVIVRPSMLTNGKRSGKYRHGTGIGNYLWTARISRADVADFMLNRLSDNTYLGKAVGVSR
ncbi:MAG: NAD(P)-dependent oxidoreductase [Calditrichaceae bacterium]